MAYICGDSHCLKRSMIIHTPITLHLGNAGRHESLVAGGGTPSTGPIIPHPDHFGHGSFERHVWHESDENRLHVPFCTSHLDVFFLITFCVVLLCFTLLYLFLLPISRWGADVYLQGDVPCAPQLSLSASAASMDLKMVKGKDS